MGHGEPSPPAACHQARAIGCRRSWAVLHHDTASRAAFSATTANATNSFSAAISFGEDCDVVAPAGDNCPATFNIDQHDTDGDGTGDACDANPTVTSTGTFTDSGQTLGSAASTGVVFGDVDGDDDLDAMVTNNNIQPNAVWINS